MLEREAEVCAEHRSGSQKVAEKWQNRQLLHDLRGVPAQRVAEGGAGVDRSEADLSRPHDTLKLRKSANSAKPRTHPPWMDVRKHSSKQFSAADAHNTGNFGGQPGS